MTHRSVEPVRNAGDALLADILACPKDDVVRLVYADWLDEVQGQTARAEFIRMQIALASIRARCRCLTCLWRRGSGWNASTTGRPCLADDPSHTLLRMKEHDLWQELCYDWFGSMLDLSFAENPANFSFSFFEAEDYTNGTWEIEVYVDRGFPWRVECTEANWLAYSSRLIKGQPIEEVWLSDRQPWRSVNDFWVWSRDFDDRETFSANMVLADSLFLFLPESDSEARMNGWPQRRWYKSEARAWEALTEACVKWARFVRGQEVKAGVAK